MSHEILIVEDDSALREALAQVLSDEGYELFSARDGLEAVNCLKKGNRPDVILLDLGMPGLNGYETCKRLRATPEGRQAFIVAQTGWGHDEDRALSQEAGFQAHLVKPVALADLARLLKDLPARPD